jgi:hypothetical protein
MDRPHNLKKMESVKETLEKQPALVHAAILWPSHVAVKYDATKIQSDMFNCVMEFLGEKEDGQCCNVTGFGFTMQTPVAELGIRHARLIITRCLDSLRFLNPWYVVAKF